MVTLVTTLGNGSMDIYAQKLAENMNAPKLHADIYQAEVRAISTRRCWEAGSGKTFT